MLNKKNSSSNNLKSAVFAAALTASTAAVSDQVNTVVTPTQNGVTATASGNGTSMSVGLQTSGNFGTSVKVGLDTEIGSGALSLVGEKGKDIERALLGAGYKLGKNAAVILKAELLKVNKDFTSSEGVEKAKGLKQESFGGTFKLFTNGFVDNLEASGKISKSDSQVLRSLTVVNDTSTEFTNSTKTIGVEGGTRKEAKIGTTLNLGKSAQLSGKVGYQHTEYEESKISEKGKTGEVMFTFNPTPYSQVNVGRSTAPSGDTNSAELKWKAMGGEVGIKAARTDGINGQKANNYGGVTFTMPLGGNNANRGYTLAHTTGTNIGAETSNATNNFASSDIVAKIIEQNTLNYKVDKTGLPPNSPTDAITGAITINALDITAISGVTLNGSVFTNSNQFSIVGGKLIINAKNISAPASGTDTYTVSVNETSGGTSNVIVTVEKGSTIVKSVVIVPVTLANIAPVANNDSETTAFNTSVLIDVLANDTDSEGNTLQVMGLTQPSSGGSVAIENGKVRFTPTAGFSGTTTFTYLAYDGVANSLTPATVSVTVDAAPDTVGPVITLNGASTINMTVGGIYTESGATALDAVDGTRPVVITGSVNTNVIGTYTLTYTSTDNAGNISTSTRTVNVNAVPNVAPVALDGSVDAGFNGFVNIDFSSLVSDDTDADSQLTFELVTNNFPNWQVSGTFPNLTLTATLSGDGNSSIQYRVIDNNSATSNIGTITINNWSN